MIHFLDGEVTGHNFYIKMYFFVVRKHQMIVLV